MKKHLFALVALAIMAINNPVSAQAPTTPPAPPPRVQATYVVKLTTLDLTAPEKKAMLVPGSKFDADTNLKGAVRMSDGITLPDGFIQPAGMPLTDALIFTNVTLNNVTLGIGSDLPPGTVLPAKPPAPRVIAGVPIADPLKAADNPQLTVATQVLDARQKALEAKITAMGSADPNTIANLQRQIDELKATKADKAELQKLDEAVQCLKQSLGATGGTTTVVTTGRTQVWTNWSWSNAETMCINGVQYYYCKSRCRYYYWN